MISKEFRLAILASGFGSTAQDILDEAVVVITNHKKAGIIDRVRDYNQKSGRNLPIFILPRIDFYVKNKSGEIDQVATNRAQAIAMAKVLQDHGVTHIAAAGYDRLIHPYIYRNYVTFNSHSGPLQPGHPDFGGPGMYGKALRLAVLNFYKIVKNYRHFDNEVTIHRVNQGFDKGEVYAYTPVPIEPGDTVESLEARTKVIETAYWHKFISGLAKRNKLIPITRSTNVILPGEEPTWEAAIKHALADRGSD